MYMDFDFDCPCLLLTTPVISYPARHHVSDSMVVNLMANIDAILLSLGLIVRCSIHIALPLNDFLRHFEFKERQKIRRVLC